MFAPSSDFSGTQILKEQHRFSLINGKSVFQLEEIYFQLVDILVANFAIIRNLVSNFITMSTLMSK